MSKEETKKANQEMKWSSAVLEDKLDKFVGLDAKLIVSIEDLSRGKYYTYNNYWKIKNILKHKWKEEFSYINLGIYLFWCIYIYFTNYNFCYTVNFIIW